MRLVAVFALNWFAWWLIYAPLSWPSIIVVNIVIWPVAGCVVTAAVCVWLWEDEYFK